MKNLYKEDVRREETPFEHIALAFSGGGFRAASFALGVLSYLYELKQQNGIPLLHNVTFVASASGGTIANAMYAQHIAGGRTFESFYRSLFDNIDGTRLLDQVFKILNDDSQWTDRPDKKRNMINAFAIAYDTCLFGGSVLGDLEAVEKESHLEEVCFNTTEFYKGLLFRQNVKMQKDEKQEKDKDFRFGNFKIHLDRAVASHLKLSDLLAASSCFPAGFEPIIFPDDFTYSAADTARNRQALTADVLLSALHVQLSQLDRQELDRLYGSDNVDRLIRELPPLPQPSDITSLFRPQQKTSRFKFGLMDGGITDNQALESILDAQERRLEGDSTSFRPFDLMLVNDVGSDFMDPYIPPGNASSYTGLKGITIFTTMIWMFVCCVMGIAAVVAGFRMDFETELLRRLAILSGTTVALLSGLLLVMLWAVRSYIRGNIKRIGGLDLDRNFSPEIVSNLFCHFGATPILVIFRLLRERFSSVLILNNDIFLKRIRFLLYKSADLSTRYTHRIKTNHIYDLAFSNDCERERQNHPIIPVQPGRYMQIVAEAAFRMGTTLWFDKTHQKKDTKAAIIACGQFTTCFNLIRYIEELKMPDKEQQGTSYYSRLSEEHRQKVDYLEGRLRIDFERFKLDPFWLYNRYGRDFHIPDFTRGDMENFELPEVFKGLR